MAPSSAGLIWSQKLEEAQRAADEAARLEFAKDYSASFAAYIKAGQTYLWLWQTHDEQSRSQTGSVNRDLKARLKQAAQKVLHRAELIKRLRDDVKPVQRQVTDLLEQDRALSAGQRHLPTHVLKFHDDSGIDQEQSSRDLEQCVSKDPELSPGMVARGAVFKSILQMNDAALHGPVIDDSVDIVQDTINDCSLIAGMIVCKEHDKRFGSKLIEGCLDDGKYTAGKYAVRMHLNGRQSSVMVESTVPSTKAGKLLCARAVTGHDGKQHLLWPAIIEKAYMSLRGTYDFEGSDSSIDVHALTGWLPDHIGLRHAGFRKEKTWHELLTASEKGQVLITAGTGKRNLGEQGDLDDFFINSHDYAVTKVNEGAEGRQITVVNPWIGRDENHAVSHTRRTRTMFWDEVCEVFDSLLLNWDPSVFRHDVRLHASWRQPGQVPASSSRRCEVALRVKPPEGTTSSADVFIHLARHVKYASERRESQFWIALHVVTLTSSQEKQSQKMGHFVDSPHVLLRCKLAAGDHTIVASYETSSDAEATFTLSAYSDAIVSFAEPIQEYSLRKELNGQWTTRTSGGSQLYSTFVNNPQYFLDLGLLDGKAVTSHPAIRILVETSREIPLQVLIVWAPQSSGGRPSLRNQRVDSIASGDVVSSSGPYSYGLAIVDAKDLRPGAAYCIIVSTYTPDYIGEFKLTMHANNHGMLKALHPIPSEGAGMHQRRLRGNWRTDEGTACGAPRHGNFMSNPSFTFEVEKKTHASFRLRTSGQSRPAVNVSIFAQQSGSEVASSGAYHNNICGASIRDVTLEVGQYIVIASTFTPNVDADFVIDAYTEHAITYTRQR